MKRLKHCGLVICLGLLFLAGSGCGRATDYVQENPRTVLGSAAGAATGAMIGGLAFDSAAATVAGTLLGGLAGGVIGNVL